MKIVWILHILAAAIIWGSAGAFIKYLGLPPVVFAWGRLVIPAAIFFFVSRPHREPIFPLRSEYSGLFLASAIYCVQIMLYMYGYSMADISDAVLVLHTWPFWAVILASLVLKEHVTWPTMAALSACLFGVALIYRSNSDASAAELTGISCMLAASFVVAILHTVFKSQSTRHHWSVMLFYQNLLGTVLLAIPAFLAFESMTLGQAGLLLTYGLVIGVLSFSLYFRALRHIKLSSAAPLIYVEVVSALIFGIVLFQEEFSLFNGLGATLILLGVALVGISQATQRTKDSARIVAFPDKTVGVEIEEAKGQTLQKHAQS